MREPFSSNFFRRLQQLQIHTRRAFLGSRQGLHISNRRGQGIEFADYRLYTAGDDFRHIDWGIYGRTDRLYVRQFRDEQDLNVLFFLDTSASMAYPAGQKKFELARDLTIALGYVALASGDSVTIGLPGERTTLCFRGTRTFAKLFHELDPIVPKGSVQLSEAVRAAAARLHIPGKCFLVSDLLVEPHEVYGALDHLRARNFEVSVLQVLAPGEIRLMLEPGEHTVVDAETGTEAHIALGPGSQREYALLLSEHIADIERYCRRTEIVHLLISSEDPVSDIVLSRLPQLGLLT